MSKILEGRKTFIGIGVLAIGAFGWTGYIAPEEWETIVKLSFELGGMIFAIYGRAVAKPKE